MAAAMAHKQDDPHWQVDKSLKECMAHMLQNDFEFNDVSFRVHCTHGQKNEKPETIRALQLLLLARSPVFYSMFTGDLAQSDRHTIDIPDIESHVFKELLRFIYTDEVHLTTENVTAVLYASKKYVITNLTKKCVRFLEDKLSPDNLASILDHSLIFDEDELKEKVLEKIQSEGSRVLSSEEFTSISKQALQEILQLNLKISNELEVFEAAMKWAERKCEEMKRPQAGRYHREALGEYINSIRFPTMSFDDFNDVVAPTEVLTEIEGYQLLRYIGAKSKKPTLNLPFSTESRYIGAKSKKPTLNLPFSTESRYIGAKSKKPTLNLPFSTESRYHSPLTASPSRTMPDATPRKLIIQGPYKSGHLVGSYVSQLKCQLSRAITLKTLYVLAGSYGSYRDLHFSLIQNRSVLHIHSGTLLLPPITAATQDMPEHHALAVNKRVAAGVLELNISLTYNLSYCKVPYSSSNTTLADANLRVSISTHSGYSILLGFEYELAL